MTSTMLTVFDHTVARIVSGGQTGADRAALDRALKKLTERAAELAPDIAKGGGAR